MGKKYIEIAELLQDIIVVDTLPSADSTTRYSLYGLTGAAGVRDRLYYGIKDTDNNYYIVPMAVGGVFHDTETYPLKIENDAGTEHALAYRDDDFAFIDTGTGGAGLKIFLIGTEEFLFGPTAFHCFNGGQLRVWNDGDTEYGLLLRTDDFLVINSAAGGGIKIESANTEVFKIDINQVTYIGDGGTTTYIEISPGGDLTFVGAGSGLPYGCIHAHDVAFDTALAAQDTWYQIDAFAANGPSNNCTPDFTNHHLTFDKPGDYIVALSWSGHSHASNDYQIMVRKNDGTVAYSELTIHQTTAVAGRVDSDAVSAIITVALTDTLEVWVMRTDGGVAAKTITTDHIGLDVVQVGGD